MNKEHTRMPIPLSKKQEKILPKSISVPGQNGGKKNPPKKTKNN